MDSPLEEELHLAIEKWRETWKKGIIDDVLQLYTENVRVMRSGLGLITGRKELKGTLLHFRGMGWADIQFVSDEIARVTCGDQSLAYQRYHEVLVRENGSEISTIYGMMIWKRVSGAWLIDMYANCHVTPEAENTTKLRASIQQSFDELGQAWAAHDLEKAMQHFSNDCVFTPGQRLKGKESIKEWLGKAFSDLKWGRLSMKVETVLPVAEMYIVSQVVHVTYPTLTVVDGSGEVAVRGCGNAIVKESDGKWEICEALWNTNLS